MEEQGKIRNYSLKFWVYYSAKAWFMSMMMALVYGICFSLFSGEIELYSVLGYCLAISIMSSQIQSGVVMRGLMSRAMSLGSTRKEAWAGMQLHGVINCVLQAGTLLVVYAIELHKDLPFRIIGIIIGVYILLLAFVRMMSAITLKSEKKWLNAIIYVLEFIVAIAVILGCIFVFLMVEEIPDFRILPAVIVWILAIVLWIVGAIILRRNTKDLEVSLS